MTEAASRSRRELLRPSWRILRAATARGWSREGESELGPVATRAPRHGLDAVRERPVSSSNPVRPIAAAVADDRRVDHLTGRVSFREGRRIRRLRRRHGRPIGRVAEREPQSRDRAVMRSTGSRARRIAAHLVARGSVVPHRPGAASQPPLETLRERSSLTPSRPSRSPQVVSHEPGRRREREASRAREARLRRACPPRPRPLPPRARVARGPGARKPLAGAMASPRRDVVARTGPAFHPSTGWDVHDPSRSAQRPYRSRRHARCSRRASGGKEEVRDGPLGNGISRDRRSWPPSSGSPGSREKPPSPASGSSALGLVLAGLSLHAAGRAPSAERNRGPPMSDRYDPRERWRWEEEREREDQGHRERSAASRATAAIRAGAPEG